MRRKEHFLPLKPSKHSKKWIHEEVQACYSRTRDGEMSEVNYDKCADVEESSWVGDFARASEVDECQREATTSDTTDATTFYPPMKSKHNGDLHPGNAPAVPPRPTRSECADVKESTRVGDIAEPHAFNGDPPASCTSDKTDATAISSLKYSKPSEYVDVDEVRRIVGFERPPAHLNAEEYLLPLNASEILPRSTSGEKQFNGNTHKHEAMVKKSTEGVSKDTPGTHPRSSTQARFNWKKATTLLVSASRFMEGVKKDVKFDPLQQKTTYPSPQAAGGVHCSSGQSDIPDTAGMQTYYPPTRSKHDLENIWTPSYYGDEEDFAKEQKDVSANWALFSTKDGRLLLKRGPRGKSYFVNGQYEVEMNDHVVTGELLSEFIENVRRAECDADETNQRNCASLIYYKDLKRFAGSKEIEPLVKKEGAKTIGMGEFGEVTLRTYPEEANDETPSRQVAVKRIKQTSRNALVGAMEVAVMCAILEDSNVSMQHLLPLVGWCVDDKDLYVVTEFMPGGSLLDYLQSLNLKGEEEVGEEEVHKQRLELYRFVSEIASGMCALEAKQIQHRDLAARNVLLTQHRQIKIGDFGLSRPDGSKFTCGRISTRWAAPEVLQNEANFTLRSDVWSFGVVMWEIYSLGSLPYSEVPSRELLNHLHSGRRLDPPYETPSRIAKLMNMCLQMPASSRPSFVEIDRFLHGLLMRQVSDAPFTVPPPLPAKILPPPASSSLPSSYIEL